MKEYSNNQFNNVNEGSKESLSQKTKRFLENTKKAVKDVIATTGIAISTLVPSSVHSLATLTAPTAAALMTACCDKPDITAPTVEIVNREINISGGETLRISGNQVYIGNTLIFRCSDDVSTSLNITITFNGKSISSGYVFNEGGTISVKARDEAGNLSSSASSTVNMLNSAPSIDLKQSEVDVSKPKVVSIESDKLTIGGDVIATWSDDKTQNCTVSLTLDGKEVKSGDTLDKEGTLVLTITDGDGKSSSVNIKLNVVNNAPTINVPQSQINIYGEIQITISGNKLLLGSEEIASRTDDRTENCTVSIKFNGKEVKSGDIINETGTLSITVTDAEGKSSTKEINITKEVIEYQDVNINNIKPVDILPIIGQVEVGDKECYSHIEHLRIAEATRIRDMMWKYGAGSHSPEQYQELMMRLNTGMLEEYPKGYEGEFELIGTSGSQGDEHSHAEWSILHYLLNHANLKVILTSGGLWQDKLETFIKENPQSICIFGCSAYAEVNKEKFNRRKENSTVRNLCKSGKLIIFKSGGNIDTDDGGVLINKTLQKDVDEDEHGTYSLQSNANGKNDINADMALLVSVGTNDKGDADQTNVEYSSSRFPVGFHNKVLFAGRAFPFHQIKTGEIWAEKESYHAYQTSFVNYTNVAIMDLCFQMFAEVKDVDELLEMVRSTCDTDYIRLDGETQPLQLMNPAKFFKKYLMPKDIPSSIQQGQTIPLNKGYYKGVVFAIPGAEVKINGQWVAYSKENEALIKSQNPMNLEWRLNGDLVAKYNKNGAVTGKVIAVDDERNGLNLDIEDVTVSIQNIAGIFTIGVGNTIMLTNLFNQGPIHNIPSSIRPGETVMLSSISNEGVIYDIPGAQPYIKGKSWVDYNDKNKALVQAQDLKNLQWRLNGDIAIKKCRNGYIKGNVYAINDKGETINKQQVIIRIEDKIQDSSHGYIADNYVKSEGNYRKSEGEYTKKLKYNKDEGKYTKHEGNYRKSIA